MPIGCHAENSAHRHQVTQGVEHGQETQVGLALARDLNLKALFIRRQADVWDPHRPAQALLNSLNVRELSSKNRRGMIPNSILRNFAALNPCWKGEIG